MKVERVVEPYRPVVITLEIEAEAEYEWHLHNCAPGQDFISYCKDKGYHPPESLGSDYGALPMFITLNKVFRPRSEP